MHTVGEYEAAQSRAACSVRPEPTIGALNTLYRARCNTGIVVLLLMCGLFIYTFFEDTREAVYMYVYTICTYIQ